MAVLRRVTEHDWADEAAILGLRFVWLEDVGLSATSTDEEIYGWCLEIGAILLTGDRTMRDGLDALENVIHRLGRDDSLPVITIAAPVKLLSDREYAEECAFNLIDCLSMIENYRGTRRIFLPFSAKGRRR